jgi:hypothetical protein
MYPKRKLYPNLVIFHSFPSVILSHYSPALHTQKKEENTAFITPLMPSRKH